MSADDASRPKNPTPLDHWPQQSPIQLLRSESFHTRLPDDYLRIEYASAPFAGTFQGEPGHKNFVLDALPHGVTPPTVTLGGTTARLAKIHLHTPSEHDLEGENQAGEIHLIHQIEHPVEGSELIVLGVCFGEAARGKESDFFQVWATELKAAKRASKKPRPAVAIDPRKLLPASTEWFRYEGSLTTEPYNEVVSWVVFRRPLGITSADLRTLRREAHQPERATQPRNRRIVLRNFE